LKGINFLVASTEYEPSPNTKISIMLLSQIFECNFGRYKLSKDIKTLRQNFKSVIQKGLAKKSLRLDTAL
jgi:hypothetical protein